MAKILMITATSDNNRTLADKFADAARKMGHEADVIDLVELDMPMFSVHALRNWMWFLEWQN